MRPNLPFTNEKPRGNTNSNWPITWVPRVSAPKHVSMVLANMIFGVEKDLTVGPRKPSLSLTWLPTFQNVPILAFL